MTVRRNEETKLWEVVDAEGKVHAADKSKANADSLDRGFGFAPPPRPMFDAIVKGIHRALTEFGYPLTVEYVGEQVEHVLRDEPVIGGPGSMAKHMIEDDIAEDQVATAKKELGL